jgi:hypothetical protein
VTDTGVASGATKCTLCVAGQFTAQSTGSCAACPAGSVTNSLTAAGASTCTPCATGQYSTGSTRPCLLCQGGSVVNTGNAAGGVSCVPCLAHFTSLQSTSQCSACATGFFQRLAGQQRCEVCQPDSWSSTCGSCHAGHTLERPRAWCAVPARRLTLSVDQVRHSVGSAQRDFTATSRRLRVPSAPLALSPIRYCQSGLLNAHHAQLVYTATFLQLHARLLRRVSQPGPGLMVTHSGCRPFGEAGLLVQAVPTHRLWRR